MYGHKVIESHCIDGETIYQFPSTDQNDIYLLIVLIERNGLWTNLGSSKLATLLWTE